MRNGVLLLCAAAAGLGASEILYRATWSRNAIGAVLGRGEFLALVRGRAIHERDLFRDGDGRAETMLAAEALRRSPRGAQVAPEKTENEMMLLRSQFEDETGFANALESAHLTEQNLRALVTDHLEVERWLEDRIAPEVFVAEEECRQFYESKREQFGLPRRFRASHIFVAAPDGTEADAMLTKRSLAQGLSVRLLAGENLKDLAAEASEDEATKENGGDLGFFSDGRVPPEFIVELEKLSVGETSSPFRSHLGFHIAQLTELKPARALDFDEVRAEIQERIANQKRAQTVASLMEIRTKPEWTRPLATQR